MQNRNSFVLQNVAKIAGRRVPASFLYLCLLPSYVCMYVCIILVNQKSLSLFTKREVQGRFLGIYKCIHGSEFAYVQCDGEVVKNTILATLEGWSMIPRPYSGDRGVLDHAVGNRFERGPVRFVRNAPLGSQADSGGEDGGRRRWGDRCDHLSLMLRLL